jgi:Coenzyme F420-reducing hydrogenase, gamma subunit
MLAAVRQLLFGVAPLDINEKVCQECKRRNTVCMMVTQAMPCMGPVTRTGCGALCPSFGAACYACYGPAENANVERLGECFMGLGLSPERVKQKFLSMHNASPEFSKATVLWADASGGHS